MQIVKQSGNAVHTEETQSRQALDGFQYIEGRRVGTVLPFKQCDLGPML
jgi:hypothetical protein